MSASSLTSHAARRLTNAAASTAVRTTTSAAACTLPHQSKRCFGILTSAVAKKRSTPATAAATASATASAAAQSAAAIAAAAAAALPDTKTKAATQSQSDNGNDELVRQRAEALRADAVEHQLDDSRLIGMNGGQIFVEMMREQEVKHLFGYPGGAILPIFDGIHACKDFDFILPRHEQGAGHMAEGYARATGKPGIVLVTSGSVK